VVTTSADDLLLVEPPNLGGAAKSWWSSQVREMPNLSEASNDLVEQHLRDAFEGWPQEQCAGPRL
jgi:hypothetical protein